MFFNKKGTCGEGRPITGVSGNAGIVCLKKQQNKHVYISTPSLYVVKIILKMFSFLQQNWINI